MGDAAPTPQTLKDLLPGEYAKVSAEVATKAAEVATANAARNADLAARNAVYIAGKDTSEHAMAQSVIGWLKWLAGIATIVGPALLASGAIPKDSTGAVILGTTLTVLGAIAGKSYTAGAYAASRAAVKAGAVIEVAP